MTDILLMLIFSLFMTAIQKYFLKKLLYRKRNLNFIVFTRDMDHTLLLLLLLLLLL
jgi:hypothetical protein